MSEVTREQVLEALTDLRKDLTDLREESAVLAARIERLQAVRRHDLDP